MVTTVGGGLKKAPIGFGIWVLTFVAPICVWGGVLGNALINCNEYSDLWSGESPHAQNACKGKSRQPGFTPVSLDIPSIQFVCSHHEDLLLGSMRADLNLKVPHRIFKQAYMSFRQGCVCGPVVA